MRKLLFILAFIPSFLFGQTTINLSPDSTKYDLHILGSGSFSPADLTDLILWLDAAVGVTEDVGVETWEDQSTSGNDMTQTTDADQPAYSTSDANFNNLPVIESDGVSEWLDFTSNLSLTDFSIFGVIDLNGYWLGSDLSSARYYDHQTTQETFRTSAGITAFTMTADGAGALIIELHRTGTSLDAFKNGTASSSNPQTNSGNGDFAAMFRRSTTFSAIKIAELIICSSEMSESDKTTVRNYLSTKYGVTLP